MLLFSSAVLLLLCTSLQSTITTGASSTYYNNNEGFLRHSQDRELQTTRTDLVRLIPFDVQIALSFEDNSDLEAINLVGLTDIITDWMSESFRVKSTSELLEDDDTGNGTVTTTLNSVALELVNQRIQTTTVASSEPLALLTTSHAGISLWDRTGTATPMDPDLVELMQRATFLEDNALLEMLLAADPSITGFPSQESVIDVRAYITPPGEDDNSPTEPPSDGNENLKIVIIIAIVVACLAFGLLIFAVLWAWKSDRSKTSTGGSAAVRSKESSKKSAKSQKMATATTEKTKGFVSRRSGAKKEAAKSKSPEQPPNTKDQLQTSALDFGGAAANVAGPSESGAGATTNEGPYPTDSVVSEDISSSLTAYYKSGMYGNTNSSKQPSRGAMMRNDFNDAASMSSMDSYGYSLDGYAPSLGPAQGGYPVGPLQAAKDAQITVGDEDDDVAAEEEDVEDYEAQT